ncbi:MAG: TonB-dependent receptor [Bacteroidetes bacterium]|nr:TonB-dependent receptor [Bacteroidota bacterium]
MKAITSKLKQFLFLSLIIFYPTIVFSQIQGAVRDTSNQPLSFANVLLLNQKDSTVATGMMATEEGTYSITNFEPGTYIMGVSMIGYKPAYSPSFVIKTSNDHHHNEPIFVEGDSHQLEDVNVVALKPLYEMKIDRMVVNVENSITSSGSTALEVLEKSPGINVDRQNNAISMNGKGGVMVMINGKQNRMPMEAAVEMLKTMSSDNIKRIELITTPPSKYDADGDAGIINIVLKKNDDFGTNGSFTLGAGIASREKLEASLNLNHHIEKINYFGTYSVTYNNARQNIDTYRKTMQDNMILESGSESGREALVTFQNFRVGLDYTISSKTVLSILGSGYLRDWEADALNEIYYKTDEVLTGQSNLKMTEYSKWMHGMANINLQHHFKEEEILDFNFDYLNYHNDNPSYYTIENFDNEGQQQPGEDIDVTKITPINIMVGMLDYTNQINPKLKVEAGAKGTFTMFKNDIGVSYLDLGIWSFDQELTNKYSMNENIMAIYSSVSYSLSDKTSIVAGLRYEYMNSVLDSETEKGIIDLHYGELFPTIYFSQKLDKNNKLQLSYSRRIDRPTFNELAPFVVFMTPELFLSGNENLLPAFSTVLKTDYQYKSVILSVSYTDTKNAISRFQPIYNEETDRTYFVSQNFDSQKITSAVLTFPIKVTDWWKMQNNFTFIFRKINTNYEGENLDYATNNYRINTIQSINITKNMSAEFAGYYQSKSFQGIYEWNPIGRLDIGVQWKLKNGNSRFNLNLSDVFKTNIIRYTADFPELKIYNTWMLDFEPRILRLTFTHNFGNSAVKTRKRTTASDEEQKRISN